MKMIVIFISILLPALLLAASLDCNKPISSIVGNMAEWIANSFTSHKSRAAAYGECFRGLFGRKPPRCDLRSLPATQPIRKCTKILNNYYQRIAKNTAPFDFNSAYSKSMMCNLGENYMMKRMEASNGGSYDASKMADYCIKNIVVCPIVEPLIQNNLNGLYSWMPLLTGKSIGQKTMDEVISWYVETNFKSSYSPERDWAIPILTACFQELFSTVLRKIK